MKITKRFLLSSLVLALPIAGAVTKDEKDVGVQVNSEVALDGSGVLPDMFEVASQASSLNPFYILESIQNTYIPSTLHTRGIIQTSTSPEPTSSDFWEEAEKSEKILQEYAHSLLKAAATYFKSSKFTDVMTTMNHIVNASAAFRDDIKVALDARGITLDAFTKELEDAFMTIMHDLDNIPFPDKPPGHAERVEMVDKILDDVAEALTKLAMRYGIDEEVVTSYLHVLKPQVRVLMITLGDINERHCQLLPALLFIIAILLIPQLWILRPLLSLFGFGPAGPIKGSIAAWMQRYFWGAAVEAGSWFSWLQAAGMGVLPNWAGFIVKTPFLIGSVTAMLRQCLNRG